MLPKFLEFHNLVSEVSRVASGKLALAVVDPPEEVSKNEKAREMNVLRFVILRNRNLTVVEIKNRLGEIRLKRLEFTLTHVYGNLEQ